MLQFYVCDLNELSNSLVLLRKDLTLFSKFGGGIPILYNNYTLSKINNRHHHVHDGKPGADEQKKIKILESLISCNFYLNALLEERIAFDACQSPINDEVLEANEEEKEQIFSSVTELKEYFEIFKEKAWKIFAELSDCSAESANGFCEIFSQMGGFENFTQPYAPINSFCAFTRSQCKTVSVQEAEEVIYAFKHSLEVYERAVTFDISHPGNAETVLSALQNVKKSTRTLQTYVWVVKTLKTHSTPNSNE